jgi:hypothetical protein
MIQVDISGHPPFPTGSKQFSGNFGNLLFLAVFRVLNFWSRFEALKNIFWENGEQHGYVPSMFLTQNCIPRIDISNECIERPKRRSYAKVTPPGS